jgi:hypothetical protein
MSNPAVETIEKDGFTAQLFYDENAQSPTDSGGDCEPTFVAWHRRYKFDEDGEKVFGTPQDFVKWAKENKAIYLPVSMYDHSGITVWVGAGPHEFDHEGWDSGQVGYVYATRELIAKWGYKRITKKVRENVLNQLGTHIKTWDQYLTGDVYGYVITGPDGENVDSCWGYYGDEYAKKEMLAALDNAIEYEQKESKKIEGMMRL